MKKIFILLLLIAAIAAPAQAAAEESVRFIIEDVQPNLLEPGYRGPLEITVRNVGFLEGYRINAEVTPAATVPINILGETKKYIEFYDAPCTDPGRCNYLNAGDTATFTYNISVDSSAASDGYTIPLTVSWRNLGLDKTATLNFGIEVVGAPELKISGTTTTPSVVYPDTEFSMSITIENIGTDDAKSVELAVTLPSGLSGTKTAQIQTLAKDKTATATLQLKAEQKVALGMHELSAKLSYQDSKGETYTDTVPLDLYIQDRGAATLTLSKVATSPSKVHANTDFTLSLTLENTGSQDAKSTKMELTLPTGVTGEASAFLGTTGDGKTSEASFDLKVEKSTRPNTYPVSAEITYIDEQGRTETVQETFNLFILERGEITLSISGINTSPSKIYPNTDVTLTLSFENTGLQDAKSAKIDLILPPEFTGEDAAYLGTIAKDGSKSAAFDIKSLKTSAPGTYTSTARITYTDGRGITSSVEEPFNIFILDRGDVILEFSGKSTSPTKLMPGSEFTLSLQLENIGDQDAKSVRIELNVNGDLKGEFTTFVGEIEQDDVSTGVFDLSIAPTAEPGPRMINADIIYLDERGIENRVVKTFDLFVSEPGGSSKTKIALVALAALGIGVYLWRRRNSEFTED
ncbi:MAG: COG1361 S-layer family protein [Candidatus Hydrothermarchaeales archaeon]